MSGTTAPPYAAFSSAALCSQEKADIREFCGYPSYGTGTVVFPAPWINVYYLALEYRMNNSQPAEWQNMRLFLSQLYILKAAIVSASANLDTDQAAVWKHNPNELRDRRNLYNEWRRDLCGFMGIPPGPNLSRAAGQVQLVV